MPHRKGRLLSDMGLLHKTVFSELCSVMKNYLKDVGLSLRLNGRGGRILPMLMLRYFKGVCQEGVISLFSVVASNKRRGNGHKRELRKFHLNMRSNFFKGGGELDQAAQRDGGG